MEVIGRMRVLQEQPRIFRYRDTTRRSALMLAMFALGVLVAATVVLVLQWSALTWFTRMAGIVALLALAAIARIQADRWSLQLELDITMLRLSQLFGKRTLAWNDIAEVRQIAINAPGTSGRWTCAVRLRSRPAQRVPLILFDNQLEQAETALALIRQRSGVELNTTVS